MSTRKKLILSFFILFHLAATIILILPDSCVQDRGRIVVWPYVNTLDLWQEWGMFAPDPSNLNMYIFARLQQCDGTTWEYWMPQLDKMGLVDRYLKNRFKVYVQEAHCDYAKMLWPDLAGWIAEQDRQRTGKQPVRIRLYRTWWNVPPPPPDTSQRPVPKWNTYMFYEMRLGNL